MMGYLSTSALKSFNSSESIVYIENYKESYYLRKYPSVTISQKDNVTFRTTLNTYFAGIFEDNNLTFSKNLLKVDSLPNIVDTRIGVTPGYSAVAANKLKELKGFICERDSFIFRKYEQGTFEFNNAATLNTSIFRHVDLLADISDRRKVCAIV